MSYNEPEPLCLALPRGEELRQGRLEIEAARAASLRAQALADPTRLTLAAALLEAGELCVWDASWVLERAPNLTSHHLRALRDAGLADTRRQGRIVYYLLTEEGRALLDLLLERPLAAA